MGSILAWEIFEGFTVDAFEASQQCHLTNMQLVFLFMYHGSIQEPSIIPRAYPGHLTRWYLRIAGNLSKLGKTSPCEATTSEEFNRVICPHT